MTSPVYLIDCIEQDSHHGYGTETMNITSNLWCIRLAYVATLDGHEGAVVAIATSPTMGDIATASVTSMYICTFSVCVVICIYTFPVCV